jgi:UrcA family protein
MDGIPAILPRRWTMLKLRFSLAGFALMLSAAPAAAERAPIFVEGAPTVKVSYSDLNLGSADGRRTLERRVARAAASLCTETGHKPLQQQMVERACLSAARSKAQIDIARAVARTSIRLASAPLVEAAAK